MRPFGLALCLVAACATEEKAFINYWYRYPWEYILPLYPGILLAAAVSGVPLYHLITANIAYAVVLFATTAYLLTFAYWTR